MSRRDLRIATLFITLWLAGCSEKSLDQTEGADPTLSARQQHLWLNNCALCHISGVGGAPRIAVASDWKPRKEQGRQVLLQHTIEGFNNMPPLGYCMACETDDFDALIDFMSAAP